MSEILRSLKLLDKNSNSTMMYRIEIKKVAERLTEACIYVTEGGYKFIFIAFQDPLLKAIEYLNIRLPNSRSQGSFFGFWASYSI